MNSNSNAQVLSSHLASLREQLKALPSSQRLSEKDGQVIYADAHGLVVQGRYGEACKRFELLTLYRSAEAKHWLGLGVCLKHLSCYDQAITAFAFAATLEPDIPEHMVAIAECELLKQETDQARDSLRSVVAFCREQRDADKTRVRAEALLGLITKGQPPA